MPRRDGSGPMGRGAMSGKCMGACNGTNAVRNGTGLGQGNRRGFGKNFIVDPTVFKTQKELLQAQKELLESKLDCISKQLEIL